MDPDPTKNVVVFEIEGRRPFVSEGPTRDDGCIKRAWSKAPFLMRLAAGSVARIHSEWEPSSADAEFIQRTFPKVELTYNFSRPAAADGWDAALTAARQQLLQAEGAAAMQHVAEHGELLPVLWSESAPNSGSIQMLPHLTLVPGKLYVALAEVATTPQGRVGMNHIAHAGLGGNSFEALLQQAFDDLTRGLRIEGMEDLDHSGEMAVVRRRQGWFASSAVALPNFYEQVSSLLRADQLLVGIPDLENVLVTPRDSGWVDEVQRRVLASTESSREFTPCVLALGVGGLSFVAERSQ